MRRAAVRLATAVLLLILVATAVARVWARNAAAFGANRALAGGDLWATPGAAADLATLTAWLDERGIAPEERLVFAYRLLERRAAAAALQLARAVQAADPAAADAYYLAGLIHTAQRDWPQASAEFAAAQAAPLRRGVGVSDIGLAAAKAAVTLLPADAVDWPQARSWLETAAATADYRFDTGPVARIETNYFLGLARRNTDDPAGALAAFDAALALQPANYWSNVYSALILWQTYDDAATALARLQIARAARPELPAAYFWAARIWCADGRTDALSDLAAEARRTLTADDYAALAPSLTCAPTTP